jgi:hypothetical protein
MPWEVVRDGGKQRAVNRHLALNAHQSLRPEQAAEYPLSE